MYRRLSLALLAILLSLPVYGQVPFRSLGSGTINTSTQLFVAVNPTGPDVLVSLGTLAGLSGAPAGTLTGSTLASGVTASSLTSAAGGNFGTGAYATAPANTVAMSDEFFTAYTASSGAFTQAQPSFGNLSGQATNAQLATQTANTVLGALTATTPSGLALPSCADTSGNHLNYTSGTGFSCGTSDANVGTVTSVATNNGVTGGTITTTGTIGLASVSNNTALCNNSGSSAVPTTANCTVTGTGNLVLASSPTLTTAALGSSTATTQTANTNNTDVATTAYVDSANLKNREVIFGLDGGGSALTAGKIIYRANSPCAGTITGAYLVGSPSGSAVVDVWKIAAGSSLPTVTNTIDASDLPTLSSANVYTDTTLTGWTTTVTAGDMWAIKLNSASTVTSLNLIIDIRCN